ncbi:MAG: hypothetical protein KAG94_00925 [Clostridiales bacterium]|nr:hypothetical protein [Clostridiales bacterium]
MSDNYYWYLSYGSNIFDERFKFYITGGYCEFNNKKYNGCTDKTWPLKNKAKIIHHKMYFAKSSSSWGGGGVCFINPIPNPKVITYGRMYLVTKEQYEQIWCQEGKSWYNKKIIIGQDEGIDIVTFTNSKNLLITKPHQSYKDVIIKGLIQTYPSLTLADITNYIS